MKMCSKCKQAKSENEFGKLSDTRDGLRYDCKACRREYNINNREQKAQYNKLYFEQNKHSVLEKNAEYRRTHADAIQKQRAEYRSREDIKEHVKLKNKKYLPIKKANIKERRKQDSNFQLSEIIRSKIHKMLRGEETTKIYWLRYTDAQALA